MDPQDPCSLNDAIASAARQDRGEYANMDLYRMDVFATDGTLVVTATGGATGWTAPTMTAMTSRLDHPRGRRPSVYSCLTPGLGLGAADGKTPSSRFMKSVRIFAGAHLVIRVPPHRVEDFLMDHAPQALHVAETEPEQLIELV